MARRADAAVTTPRDSCWWPGHAAAGAITCAGVLVVIAAMVSTGVELGSPRRSGRQLQCRTARTGTLSACTSSPEFSPAAWRSCRFSCFPGAGPLLPGNAVHRPLPARRHLLNVPRDRGPADGRLGAHVGRACADDREDPGYWRRLPPEQADAARIRQLSNTGDPARRGAYSSCGTTPRPKAPSCSSSTAASCHDHAGGAE